MAALALHVAASAMRPPRIGKPRKGSTWEKFPGHHAVSVICQGSVSTVDFGLGLELKITASLPGLSMSLKPAGAYKHWIDVSSDLVVIHSCPSHRR